MGFRPFAYRLATELGLTGFVLNNSAGVTIEVQGDAEAIGAFAHRLCAELPPLASIESCEEREVPAASDERAFDIRPSAGGELTDAQITVDTATCADCLRELADPTDPRFGYPFINCTNCGPRYSIVRAIPYDRQYTTMSEFAMCPLCAAQYADPADRRFHAQPVACPACGPMVSLVDSRGVSIDCDGPIARAAAMLAEGRIVAIKGLGGFQLACRADDDNAVRRLRRRKRRDAKPFALMVADLDHARAICDVDETAEALLMGPLRPIVLLSRRGAAAVAKDVADGLDTLGVMLPYTPLHHLIFADEAIRDVPLVMTSGNISDEPLVKDNDAAVAHLGQIADAMLLHNRPIERRVDDSVVQVAPDGRATVFRRARGYAPVPVAITIGNSAQAPAVLAVGGELKNAVCLYRDGRALLSEHIGDLKDARVYRHFIDTINHLERLFDVSPQLLAADLHPQYLSTEYALRRHRGQLADHEALPIVRVQHHHAHIASCMAEHGRCDPVIGLACDGVGYGDDGAVWGCEVFRCDLRDYQRLGHLRYVPLPGGDAAAVETFRPALAALWDTFGDELYDMPIARQLAGGDDALARLIQLLTAGLNCPPSSSLGRWFDAAAALCEVAMKNDFEGQAPMRLESQIAPGVENAYDFKLIGPRDAAGEAFRIDLRPMVAEIVNDLAAGFDAGVVAARFHNTVVAFLLASARRARELTGLDVVALSGGCFANRYVTGRLIDRLDADGFQTLGHRTMPCNDGCIALGQAAVAVARSAD